MWYRTPSCHHSRGRGTSVMASESSRESFDERGDGGSPTHDGRPSVAAWSMIRGSSGGGAAHGRGGPAHPRRGVLYVGPAGLHTDDGIGVRGVKFRDLPPAAVETGACAFPGLSPSRIRHRPIPVAAQPE